MTTELDRDYQNDLRASYKQAASRYRTTPWWRLLKRRKRMEAIRLNAANLSGMGIELPSRFPETARAKVMEPLVTAGTYGLPVILAIACIFGLASLIDYADHGDQSLPRGVTQRGGDFILEPNYAANPERWKAETMCGRLPTSSNGVSDVKSIQAQPDGTLVIHCELHQDTNDNGDDSAN